MFVGNIYKELSLTVVLVLVVLFNFIRQYIGSIYRIIIMYILYTCCMLALLPVYISHLSDTERIYCIYSTQYSAFAYLHVSILHMCTLFCFSSLHPITTLVSVFSSRPFTQTFTTRTSAHVSKPFSPP